MKYFSLIPVILLVSLTVISLTGCGGPASEASGTPVPENYEQQQQEAQAKAREEAMKYAKKKK